VIAAVVALPTIGALLPSRLDGLTSVRTRASTSTNTATATLVGVKVLMMGDDPSTADAARAARAGAQCTNPRAGTRAYNLRGIRVSGPTTAHLNPAGASAGAASAFQAAFNTWRAADPNAPSITVVTDSSVSSPQADGRYELMFAPLAGRTLAVTYTWTRRGVAESDVVFNSKVSFFNAPGEGDGCYEGVHQYDLQNVATHEFGHVYGLDHVSATYNTMAPTATLGETYKRSLATGDAAGMRAIY
jgi:hypothetical protein